MLVWVGIAFLAVAVLVTIWVIKGFFRVDQEERAVIEWAWGGYWFTAGPGLSWRPPLFSHIRTFLRVWEREIPIFEEETWIDLVDGSVRPRGGKGFVRIVDPLSYEDPPKPIYNVENWVSAVKTLVETQVSTYLRGLTIDEALQEGKAGFDLAQQINRKRLELQRTVRRLRQEVGNASTEEETQIKNKEVERIYRLQQDLLAAMKEFERIKQDWGLEITNVFIPEYDLSQSVLESRNRVQEEERKAKAEEYTLRRRVLESVGVFEKIRQQLMNNGYSPEEADKRASELWEYLRGTETGSLLDIRGGGILDAAVAQFIRNYLKGAEK